MKNIQYKNLIWVSLVSFTLSSSQASGTNQLNNVAGLPYLSVQSNHSNSSSFACFNSIFGCSINLNSSSNASQTLTVTSPNDSTVTIATFSIPSNISNYVTISYPNDASASTTACKVPCTVLFTQIQGGLSGSIYFKGTSSNGTQTTTGNIPITTTGSS